MTNIQFKTISKELTKDYPIQKASLDNFEWYKKMVGDLRKTSKFELHTGRCPGIISVCNEGWYLVNYQDIEIKTCGHDRDFTWKSEIDQKKLIGYDYVHYHTFNQLKKFKEFRKDTLHTLIKIQTPWFADIPKGYYLLVLPLPYTDELRFTSSTGILKGRSALNTQLFWHIKNGTEVIKKGTLLAQLILIKEDKINYSVLQATEEEIQERKDYYKKIEDRIHKK